MPDHDTNAHPSRRLRVGIAGFGFMGQTHLRAWRAAGAEVAAVCDRDPARLQATVRGNLGDADAADLRGVAVYPDLASLLAEARPDAVSITLPTAAHADAARLALEAGVHVLCEKPMALTVADCDRLMAAAARSGALLMPAHCIRFWPAYVVAHDLLRSGRYGAVRAASFRRFSTLPAWSSGGWLMDEQLSGGMPLDLHLHDADCIRWWFGAPRAVSVRGVRTPEAGVVHLTAAFDVGGPTVTAEASWAMPASFGFEMAFTLVLERAVVEFSSRREPGLMVYPAEGGAFAPEVLAGDGYTREVAHFARRLRGETGEAVVTAADARAAVRVIEAERASLRTGGWVAVDTKGDGT